MNLDVVSGVAMGKDTVFALQIFLYIYIIFHQKNLFLNSIYVGRHDKMV